MTTRPIPPRSDRPGPDDDEQELDSALLDRYWRGETSASETDLVDVWLAAHPERAARAEQVRRHLVDGDRPAVAPEVTHRVISAVLAATAKDTTPQPSRDAIRQPELLPMSKTKFAVQAQRLSLASRRSRGGSRPAKRSAWIAAPLGLCVVLLAVMASVSHVFTRTAFSSVHSRTYVTRPGQLATARLADGSRITLAPGTTLILDDDPTRHRRWVSLLGEAHFEVTPDVNAPFIVRSGTITTRVLGTTFDVRRYAGDASERVTVTSGKVMVGTTRAPVILTAGMWGRFSDSVVDVTNMRTPDVYTDWSSEQLVFRDASVSEMLTTLSRWYGYTFRLADSSIARQRITAVFRVGETADMMRLVQHMLHVRMTFADSVVTLLPNRQERVPTKLSPARDPRFAPSMPSEIGR